MGTKRSVLTDENGLPLAVILSGANTHDVKLLGGTLDSLVIVRPEASGEKPQNLRMDAGYTGHRDEAEASIILHTFALAVRRRRNWNIIPAPAPAAGLWRLSILL